MLLGDKLFFKPLNLDTDMTDKVCIVTGATGALGFEMCKQLASMNAIVIMGVKDIAKGNEACQSIIEETGNENVQALPLDLGSLGSVHRFVEEFLAMEMPLHVLVNNAAVLSVPSQETKDGFDLQSQVNYLSPFVLTNLLLERMIDSAPARIINVSAVFHYCGKPNMDVMTGSQACNGMQCFCNSKYALVQFTYELANRLHGTGVTANIVDPLLSQSTNWKNMKAGLLKPVFGFAQKLLGQSTWAAAQQFTWVATAPELEEVTGEYFIIGKPCHNLAKKYNPEEAKWLWKQTKKILGIETVV